MFPAGEGVVLISVFGLFDLRSAHKFVTWVCRFALVGSVVCRSVGDFACLWCRSLAVVGFCDPRICDPGGGWVCWWCLLPWPF